MITKSQQAAIIALIAAILGAVAAFTSPDEPEPQVVVEGTASVPSAGADDEAPPEIAP